MARIRAAAGRYPIRVVSRLTGIGIDTLRAWERRHGAVTPTRDDRGRLYSDEDVARLQLLQQAVAAGHAVGRIAALRDADLRRLTAGPAAPPAPAGRDGLDTLRLQAALRGFDTLALDQELSRLAALVPPAELVRDVLLPALRQVGDAWHRRGGIAREHALSSAMRHLLGSFLRLFSRPHGAVRLLFSTPAGDRHEIGILGASMLAASHGLNASYVGPDLPADEILEAVEASGAGVLVLGITLPDVPNLARELRAIARGLPARTELWAGGAGAAGQAGPLGPRALVLPDFDAYLRQLARVGGRAS